MKMLIDSLEDLFTYLINFRQFFNKKKIKLIKIKNLTFKNETLKFEVHSQIKH